MNACEKRENAIKWALAEWKRLDNDKKDELKKLIINHLLDIDEDKLQARLKKDLEESGFKPASCDMFISGFFKFVDEAIFGEIMNIIKQFVVKQDVEVVGKFKTNKSGWIPPVIK